MAGLVGRELALLQAVHAEPGLTRADAARRLGIGSGAVTEIVARLTGRGLLSEQAAAPSGARGRPTTVLVAHPQGPLVLAAAITQETWQVDATELGGAVVTTARGRHRGQDGPQVLAVVRDVVRRLRRRAPGRVRGLGLSVPGTVRDGHVLDAVNLGWQDLELRAAWPRAALFVADNDATLAALAESRRGVASAALLHLHLHVEAGLGGAVISRGTLISGSRGLAGEFGHMPFGDPAVSCPCGAAGCWGTAVDGAALARLMGAQEPGDPVTYARQILGDARSGTRQLAAVRTVAAALGRGIAGLVNGLDPDLVTLGGLGADLLDVGPEALSDAYLAGLMEFRRSSPPPIVAAMLGETGPLVGAAENVWNRLWERL